MNTMTGDPNWENRPSIFGFEPYPPHNTQPIDWNRIPFDRTPQVIPVGQFNPQSDNHETRLELGNFSFNNAQTPHPAQFPFTTSGDNGGLQASNARCKRKTEAPSAQPYKQHITEEKMAEHMARLHISSESVTSFKETENDRTKRLYMCEEMRKLQHDSILPQSLLSTINRPCTALVLWTPPQRVMPLESLENNNEDSIPDHNRMVGEVVMESDVNNMDLDNV